MTDPWAMALEAMFNGLGSSAAQYEPKGGGTVPVRVIVSRPDRAAKFAGGAQVLLASHSVEVRMSEVTSPSPGDSFVVAELHLTLPEHAPPQGDAEGLTWFCWAEPAA